MPTLNCSIILLSMKNENYEKLKNVGVGQNPILTLTDYYYTARNTVHYSKQAKQNYTNTYTN